MKHTSARGVPPRTADKEGYRSEFPYGTFSRTVSLLSAIDPGEVKASYTDGILEIRVPLPEQGTPENRKVPISRG
ncbi:HSP20 family molecular chaperone IbpA [Arthrobacter sp. UYNi723]